MGFENEKDMKLDKIKSAEWIANRRSVYPKEFEEGEVGMDDVLACLDVAKWAPTHKLTQPWRFCVFAGSSKTDLFESLASHYLEVNDRTEHVMLKSDKMRTNARRSSVVVAVIMKRDAQERVPLDEELWSVACAVQNIHLHAASLDIGMYWSTGALTNSDLVREKLNLHSDDRHMGWLFLGKYSKVKDLARERIGSDSYVEVRS
mgnify:CR=1 FL=1